MTAPTAPRWSGGSGRCAGHPELADKLCCAKWLDRRQAADGCRDPHQSGRNGLTMTSTQSKPTGGIGPTRPAGMEEQGQTAITHRYGRLAGLYDLYTEPMEWADLGRRRRWLLAKASGTTLEVGIGTGRSLDYYPAHIRLVGIDVAPRMLQRAARRANRRGMDLRLQQADVQQFPFPSRSFDTVVATCVFCSVADSVRGLAELDRVVQAGGTVLLLEHVRPAAACSDGSRTSSARSPDACSASTSCREPRRVDRCWGSGLHGMPGWFRGGATSSALRGSGSGSSRAVDCLLGTCHGARLGRSCAGSRV